MQEPQQPTYQQQIATFREQIDLALAASPSNDFSPAWREATVELGVADLLGNSLRGTIYEIFHRNQITPATAAAELTELGERLNLLNETVRELLAGLDGLGIEAETLESGEFEIAILIPRRAVRNQLKPLGEELIQLERLLGPFAELSTGSRPEFKVRAISSSDFGVFLASVGPIAACLAFAVERVVGLYKQLLEIRSLRQKLSAEGLSDESLAGIKSHADDHMSTGIGIAVEDLITQFASKADSSRLNELRIELRLSLNAIANRIDQGYNVDVRVGAPPQDAGGEDPDPDAIRDYNAVMERRSGLQFINRSGDPILELRERPPDQRQADTPVADEPRAPERARGDASANVKPQKPAAQSRSRRTSTPKPADKSK